VTKYIDKKKHCKGITLILILMVGTCSMVYNIYGTVRAKLKIYLTMDLFVMTQDVSDCII